jgi:hypothetical protein
MEWQKSLCLLALLFAWVIVVNVPVLRFDMMYYEQPMLYLLNQAIHSVGDLWRIYADPRLLDVAVPFFRPSGHFLLYQLVTPVLGWHNTRGLLAVNFFFLALTGFFMIKLYAALFPGRRVGGYIAFALYAMQPALMISRLTPMHFEYAYVFFTVLGLYCFVLFCQHNALSARVSLAGVVLQRHGLLVGALLCLLVGATCKEPVLMLGPVMASYLGILLFARDLKFLRQKIFLQIVMLLAVVTVCLVSYLTWPWHGFMNPARATVHVTEVLVSIKGFLREMLSLTPNDPLQSGVVGREKVWRVVAVPTVMHIITWCCAAAVLFASVLLVRQRDLALRSMVFLATATLLFLLLPIAWAAGFPWHLSLSLLCLAMMMGFSAEYLFAVVSGDRQWGRACMLVCFIVFSVAAWQVNQKNIDYLNKTLSGFELRVNRNAVHHPPALQGLTKASVLIVEDSQDLSDYALGNGAYPLFAVENFDYAAFLKKQRYYKLQYQLLYNGTLFRLAYLMPTLQEEIFPFQINKMNQVADEAIYHWLQHINNIFCVGYDKNGDWFDRTAAFKKNVLAEQARRHLVLHPYRQLAGTLLSGEKLYSRRTALPRPHWCQMTCDRDSHCQGFSYLSGSKEGKPVIGCEFYRAVTEAAATPCAVCTGFIKTG